MNRFAIRAAVAVVAATLTLAAGALADETTVTTQPDGTTTRTTQQTTPAPAPGVPQTQVIQTAQPPVTTTAPEQTARTYSAPNTTLIGTGVIVFGVSYAAAAVVAGTSNHFGDSHLWVPIAGPWMDLADRGGCGGDRQPSCDNETANKVMLVVDGVFQGIGVLSVIGGFLSPETRSEVRTTAAKVEAPKPRVTITPARYGQGGYGLAAVGTF